MYFEKPDKKFCLLIILASAAGFLAGLLLIGNSNLISTEKAGLFSDYYLRQYSYLEIDRAELAWMIARERGKWLLLMWALGFTWAGMFCVYLFAGLWGFFGAVLIGMAFIKKGIFGIGLTILFGIPQMFIYIPLWFWILYVVCEKSKVSRRLRRMGTASQNNRQYLFQFICAGLGLVLGILTESYLNSWIIQQVLRMI